MRTFVLDRKHTKPSRRLSIKTLKLPAFWLSITFTVFLSGCESVNTKDMGSGLKTFGGKIGSGVSSGFNKLKSGGSDKKDKKRNNEDKIVSKFPLNEIPHTLMKKPVASGTLTSGHGYRFSPTGVPLPKKHKGIDYGAPTGTPIFAAGDGVIDKHYVSSSYGNYIRIKHKNDFQTAYAHMNAFAKGLQIGTQVKRGQTIGFVGSTGRSSGPHLHHELLYRGKSIDPLFKYTPPAKKEAPTTEKAPQS